MVLPNILLKMRLALVLFIINSLSAQLYIPADSFDLLFTEQKIMMGGDDHGSLMIRPVIPQIKQSRGVWSLKLRNEFFYNSDAPNLENTSNRWIGKGVSFFTSANIAYNSEFIFASIEPYYFISQNNDYIEPQRLPIFSQLNDNRPHIETPYTSIGIREAQLYLNFNGFGGGFSNANMWWGPGFHSSLMMTNNTTGFGHLMLGTINEKRIKNWGFNGRYVLSKFDKKNASKPYYSGFIINATYYSIPTITVGFARAFLSGGKNTNADISLLEAALLPFEIVKIERPNNQEDLLNPVDQTFTGYINLRFPKSGTVLYLEWGRNEGYKSFEDFILTPDHSDAFTIGVRKYGLFNNINFFAATEYTNIAHSSFWKMKATNDWYSNSQFDYYTYDGRLWAAHSGPDSDDLTILIGYSNKGLSIIPSFNYERHSLTHTYVLLDQKANTIVYDKF
ncbi:MAG: capsule assembly Wzi family protein, partial [Candidatus Neomarinimicrobiota bacterium]